MNFSVVFAGTCFPLGIYLNLRRITRILACFISIYDDLRRFTRVYDSLREFLRSLVDTPPAVKLAQRSQCARRQCLRSDHAYMGDLQCRRS